jgi:hypothetical protein
MKQFKIGAILVFALSFFLNSCTIEKRVYSSGYYIDWHIKNKKSVLEKKLDDIKLDDNSVSYNSTLIDFNSSKKIVDQNNLLFDSYLTSDIDNAITINSNKSKSNIILEKSTKKIEKDSCDLIILKNGQEVLAKVFEVTISEVKYKECSNLDGPVFTKRKSDFFMIKYSNGTNTVFNNEEVATTSTSNSTGPGDRGSQTVAFVLCLLVGVFGIHRFYLGHIGMGILYLLTAGLCGIGWLVDIIMICTGDLKPRNGDYMEKW